MRENFESDLQQALNALQNRYPRVDMSELESAIDSALDDMDFTTEYAVTVRVVVEATAYVMAESADAAADKALNEDWENIEMDGSVESVESVELTEEV